MLDNRTLLHPRRLSCLAAPVLVARHFFSGPAATRSGGPRLGTPAATTAMPANLWQEPTLWAEAIMDCGEAPWPPLGGIAAQACPILSRDQ